MLRNDKKAVETR